MGEKLRELFIYPFRLYPPKGYGNATCIPSLLMEADISFVSFLTQLVDMQGELALEVRSLVLRNPLLGSETVEHTRHLYICSLSLGLVGHRAETTNSVTGSFSIITVTKTAAGSLTDALQS